MTNLSSQSNLNPSFGILLFTTHLIWLLRQMKKKANFFLGIWIICDLVNNSSPTTLFYILESILNVILLLDVFLRLWIKGCYSYWRSCTDVFLFIVVILCAACTGVSMASKSTFTIDFSSFQSELEEAIDIALMSCVCVFQYIRIFLLITKQYQTKVIFYYFRSELNDL